MRDINEIANLALIGVVANKRINSASPNQHLVNLLASVREHLKLRPMPTDEEMYAP
jgi:hypothetical protein